MQINTIPCYFIIGALVFNIIMEGQLHAYKAPEPHVPHVEYFSYSTNNLSYTGSLATTSGSGVIFSSKNLI